MCRLLGFVAQTPTSACDVLGVDRYAEFTALSDLHADGWGAAWTTDFGTRRYAAPVAAKADPDYARLMRQPLGAAGLVHLRWATESMAVRQENTHPFVVGDAAFIHNGSILPAADIDRMLSSASRSALIGSTDSERYFQLVLQRAEITGNLVDGVRSAVTDLRAAFPSASLNAMLLDPANLIVVHASSTARPPTDDIAARYPGMVGAPPDHGDAYFHLRARIDPHLIVVASTGMHTTDWVDLPPDTLLVAARADLSTRQLPLEPASARP